MSKTFKKPYNVKLPRQRNDEEEFGGGKKGLILCKVCTNAYFKKSWRHDLQGIKDFRKDLPIHFTVCPACKMIADGQYEGRIVIKNIPEKFFDELDGLIRNFCHRSFERDPLDRLIGIRKLGNGKLGNTWEATTTENQLANKLAKKIKEVFDKVKITTRFSKAPSDLVEIAIDF
jgi:hypothetical protein